MKKVGLSSKLHERRINDSPIDIEEEVTSCDSDASVIVRPSNESDTETDSE